MWKFCRFTVDSTKQKPTTQCCWWIYIYPRRYTNVGIHWDASPTQKHSPLGLFNTFKLRDPNPNLHVWWLHLGWVGGGKHPKYPKGFFKSTIHCVVGKDLKIGDCHPISWYSVQGMMGIITRKANFVLPPPPPKKKTSFPHKVQHIL